MNTYRTIIAGALRSFIILSVLMLLYIHWTWWMAGEGFPPLWWLYDLAFAALLALFWAMSAVILRMNKGS